MKLREIQGFIPKLTTSENNIDFRTRHWERSWCRFSSVHISLRQNTTWWQIASICGIAFRHHNWFDMAQIPRLLYSSRSVVMCFYTCADMPWVYTFCRDLHIGFIYLDIICIAQKNGPGRVVAAAAICTVLERFTTGSKKGRFLLLFDYDWCPKYASICLDLAKMWFL